MNRAADRITGIALPSGEDGVDWAGAGHLSMCTLRDFD